MPAGVKQHLNYGLILSHKYFEIKCWAEAFSTTVCQLHKQKHYAQQLKIVIKLRSRYLLSDVQASGLKSCSIS